MTAIFMNTYANMLKNFNLINKINTNENINNILTNYFNEKTNNYEI